MQKYDFYLIYANILIAILVKNTKYNTNMQIYSYLCHIQFIEI